MIGAGFLLQFACQSLANSFGTALKDFPLPELAIRTASGLQPEGSQSQLKY